MAHEVTELVIGRAKALIESHLSVIMEDPVIAADQLYFPPGLNRGPVDVYIRTMRRLGPFEVLSLTLYSIIEVRALRDFAAASVCILTVVNCGLGTRECAITVWWIPEGDRYLISAKPTNWVLELLRQDKEYGAELL